MLGQTTTPPPPPALTTITTTSIQAKGLWGWRPMQVDGIWGWGGGEQRWGELSICLTSACLLLGEHHKWFTNGSGRAKHDWVARSAIDEWHQGRFPCRFNGGICCLSCGVDSYSLVKSTQADLTECVECFGWRMCEIVKSVSVDICCQ